MQQIQLETHTGATLNGNNKDKINSTKIAGNMQTTSL